MIKVYYVEYRNEEKYCLYAVPAINRKRARAKAMARLKDFHDTPVTLLLITDDITKLKGKPTQIIDQIQP